MLRTRDGYRRNVAKKDWEKVRHSGILKAVNLPTGGQSPMSEVKGVRNVFRAPLPGKSGEAPWCARASPRLLRRPWLSL